MATITNSDFENFGGSKNFKAVLKSKLQPKKYQKVIKLYQYETELLKLQTELVNLQHWVAKRGAGAGG